MLLEDFELLGDVVELFSILDGLLFVLALNLLVEVVVARVLLLSHLSLLLLYLDDLDLLQLLLFIHLALLARQLQILQLVLLRGQRLVNDL